MWNIAEKTCLHSALELIQCKLGDSVEKKSCYVCNKEELSKNEIGLNKKLIHPKTERMMCMACLAEYFEITEEELKEIIEIYKQQGCVLFG